MVGIFRFDDVGRSFDEGYGRVNALRTDRARMDAGSALSSGDYRGAANALYGAGELEVGSRVQGMGEIRQAAAAKATKDRETEVLTFTGEMAQRLSSIADEAGDDPNAIVGAFDTYFAPKLQQLGETPKEVAQIRQMIASNPRHGLLTLGGVAAKQLGYDVKVVGDEALVFKGGDLVGRYRGAKTLNVGEGGAVYEIPGTGGATTPSAPDPDVAPTSQGGVDPAMMGALIEQESGGDGNAIGPQTRYGQALGSTQMLPETAESMARKLGLPWRPDLMRGDTPTAMSYQRRLGEAYLQEGLDKYGGDTRKALMYYHGGPDESLWGPKTNAYADSIMRRMGQGGEALAGGSGGDTVLPYEVAQNGGTPAPPTGPRLLVQRPKAPKEQYRTLSAHEVQQLGLPDDGIYQQGPSGQISAIRQPRNNEKPTDGMKRNVALTHRMLDANERLNDVIQSGVTRPSYWKLVSEGGGPARLELRSDEDRRFVGAAKEWLAPILRKDTGAAVTDQEFLFYADTYIPAPGDSPAVLRQKAEARQSAMVAMVGEAGPLYTQTHGRREFRARWAPEARGGSDAIRSVKTIDEARALPPGTKFRTPDGRVKVR